MSNKRSRPSKNARPAGKPSPGPTSGLSTLTLDVLEGAPVAQEQYQDALTLEELTAEEFPVIESAAPVTSSKLKEALQYSTKAAALYREARQRVEGKEQDLQRREREFGEQERALQTRTLPLQQLEHTLNLRQEEVLRRELEAEGGFQAKHRALLALVENDRQREHTRNEADAASNRAEADRLRDLERRLHQSVLDAKVRAEELDDEQDRLQARIERRVNVVRAEYAEEVQSLTRQFEIAASSRDALQQEVDEHRQRRRQLGHLSEGALQAALQDAQQQLLVLERELSTRPNADFMRQFQALSKQNEDLVSENARLMSDCALYTTDLSRMNAERERLVTVKLERDILQQRSDILTTTLENLKEEVQAYRSIGGDKPVFSSFNSMDKDPALSKLRPVPRMPDLTLAGLVPALRTRMASFPKPADRRFYGERDVRVFLGGLAMSRLHLLLGISGTGKTSLPRAAARALGWTAPVIEIQAGWTDRADLIGHYNAFEKRYYETEFLKALYAAQMPGQSEVPHLIVLDEMNLSHPEQYFADLLSLIERAEGDRPLGIMSTAPAPRPAGLRQGPNDGLYLELPNNVWFVGTANKDDTTKTFADKTFDRSHVMELPRHREQVAIQPNLPELQLSYRQLQDLFSEAQRQFALQADEVYGKLDRVFGPVLSSRFGLGWGGRLEKQLRAFVPVILSAGGTVGEAFDHVLSTRLLRKLEGSFGLNPDHLKGLLQLLDDQWFDDGSLPEHSSALVQRLVDEQEAEG